MIGDRCKDRPGTSTATDARLLPTRDAACCAAPWLAPWVAGPPQRLIRLDGRAGRYAYYRFAGTHRMIALEGPAGLGLPIAIVLSRPVLARAMAARCVTLGHHRLRLDGQSLPLICDGELPPRFAADAAQARRARTTLEVLVAEQSRPEAHAAVWVAVARFAAAMEAGEGSRLVSAADGLIGLGPGSTPAGDDVLAAAAATLTAFASGINGTGRIESTLTYLRTAIAACVHCTTPLSAALLGAAARGHMIAPLVRCLETLMRGEPAVAAVRALSGVGHSSGHFFAIGASVALSVVASRAPVES